MQEKEYDLTDEQIIELRIAHRGAKEKRDADRIKAVYSLGTGWSLEEVADILMLDSESIRNYMRKYKKGGLEELLKNNYLGSETYLSRTELKGLTKHLEKETYLTVDAIIFHVQEKYEINYTKSGMTQLLHRLGFTYKKAKAVPGKADAEQQKEYLSQYKEMLKNKGENDPHYFLDGAHPQHNTMLSYGWVKKGKEKFIKANTGRGRININGALNVETLDVVTQIEETINAQAMIDLLKTLELKHPLAKTIYATLDNAPYNRSRVLKDYLKTSKIKLMFLPPYSPNLNLIERLWKFMKKKVLYNKYYEKYSDFKKAIERFFEEIDSYSNELNSLLTQNFQILNAVV